MDKTKLEHSLLHPLLNDLLVEYEKKEEWTDYLNRGIEDIKSNYESKFIRDTMESFINQMNDKIASLFPSFSSFEPNFKFYVDGRRVKQKQSNESITVIYDYSYEGLDFPTQWNELSSFMKNFESDTLKKYRKIEERTQIFEKEFIGEMVIGKLKDHFKGNPLFEHYFLKQAQINKAPNFIWFASAPSYYKRKYDGEGKLTHMEYTKEKIIALDYSSDVFEKMNNREYWNSLIQDMYPNILRIVNSLMKNFANFEADKIEHFVARKADMFNFHKKGYRMAQNEEECNHLSFGTFGVYRGILVFSLDFLDLSPAEMEDARKTIYKIEKIQNNLGFVHPRLVREISFSNQSDDGSLYHNEMNPEQIQSRTWNLERRAECVFEIESLIEKNPQSEEIYELISHSNYLPLRTFYFKKYRKDVVDKDGNVYEFFYIRGKSKRRVAFKNKKMISTSKRKKIIRAAHM